MLSDDETVILIDRRVDVQIQAKALGYELVAFAREPSPIGSATLTVALLRPMPGIAPTCQPASLGARSSRPSFVKLLDRFYIPAAGDQVIAALFFQLIAERYEEFSAVEVNRRTAEILLRAAVNTTLGDGPLKVLDFGCGTGCAIDALKALCRDGPNVDLVGTDLSESMLAIARGRGEVVVPLTEWRAMPAGSFCAAISCFVLHYGVPEADLIRIAHQLLPGGVFSANLFKGDEDQLARLSRILGMGGLDLVSNEQLSITPHSYNRHLVFKKRLDWSAS